MYYPKAEGCAVSATNLHTSSVLYRYCGTTRSLCSWSATTCTTSMLLEHQVFMPQTPLAVHRSTARARSRPVSKHTSIVTRSRVCATRQTAHGSSLTNQIAHNHMVIFTTIMTLEPASHHVSSCSISCVCACVCACMRACARMCVFVCVQAWVPA